MKTEDLIKYELPSWVEFISNKWLQGIIGQFYGKRVQRKLIRLQKRQLREEYLRYKGMIK